MSRDLRNQNPDDQSGHSTSELDWHAFRYVSDEMSDSERGEFEKRLETDPEAQAALVDVVQSTQLIYAALDSQHDSQTDLQDSQKVNVASRASSKPGLQRLRAVLSAAAAILLMVAGWSIYSGNQNSPEAAFNNTQSSADLAVAWADTLSARDLVTVEAELDELAEEVEFEDFVSYGSLEESRGWVYAALVEMEESAEVPE